MSKVCNKCFTPRELIDFYKDKNFKDGHRTICKFCDVERRIIFAKANPDKTAKNKKKYANTHVDKLKINKEKLGKEYFSKKRKEYFERNKDKCNALTANYRAKRKNATLNLSKDQNILIGEFYKESVKLSKETGIPHQVDHIVPLRGATVSGLHVPWNLQVITKEENIKKGNKYV